MKGWLPITVFVIAGIVGCKEPSSPSTAAEPELRFGRTPPPPPNPTASVRLPLADGALNLKSDGAFGDGTYSHYSEGVCGVTATIFFGGSGDMVMHAGNPRYADQTCPWYPRKATILYPDGTSDLATGVFIRVAQLQTATFRIPIGTSALRQLNVQTASARCEGVYWGGVGGDSVIVTRTAANTWHVTTQPYPNDWGSCKNTVGKKIVGTPLGSMPVDLWIVSSGTALP